MIRNLLKYILVVLVCLTTASCRKYTMPPEPTVGTPPITGLYILNDERDLSGPPFYSASTLSFYNLSTRQVTPDQYYSANGKTLGYTGNDMEIYGSKMYITVTNSGIVDIGNAKTGRLVKQDSLLNLTAGL